MDADIMPPRADEYRHLAYDDAHKLALVFVEMAHLTGNWVHLPEHLLALRMRLATRGA